MTSGAALFLDLLRANGVTHVFGNPGTTELPLVDAFAAETGIRYILGLNEVVVLGMADGYAQASGRLAVANLHAAPGLGNAMGMLYNAAKAGAPILVTAGQQDTSIALTEPLLWADLATLARPLVKWSHEVARVDDLPRSVHRAAKVALTAPTGPVFLSIPGDVLTADAAGIDPMAPTRIGGRVRADAASLAAAADLIAAATAPLIFAGDAVPRSDAHPELAALAEAIGAPVYLEGMANTAAFPSDHRLYAGSVARMTPAVRALTDGHDLIISIGADLLTQSQAAGVEALAPGKALIHFDDDPWEVGKNFPATVGLVGNAKATLPELTAAVLARMTPAVARADAVAADLAGKRAAICARAAAEADIIPLRPLAVLAAIADGLPADAIVVEETLSTGMNTVRHLMPAVRPDSWFGMRGGGIGVALPQAIGIKIARDRPVLALSGDGSAMYAIQALWTAAHYGLGIVAVIVNNRSYRILKQRTRALGGASAATDTYVGMDLTDPAIDFVALSEAQGVPAERVATLPDLRAALARGFAGPGPRLIEVIIDDTI